MTVPNCCSTAFTTRNAEPDAAGLLIGRGTTVNVEATEDALVAGESRFTDRLDLRWANGEG